MLYLVARTSPVMSVALLSEKTLSPVGAYTGALTARSANFYAQLKRLSSSDRSRACLQLLNFPPGTIGLRDRDAGAVELGCRLPGRADHGFAGTSPGW